MIRTVNVIGNIKHSLTPQTTKKSLISQPVVIVKQSAI